jgi:hypothetical protein
MFTWPSGRSALVEAGGAAAGGAAARPAGFVAGSPAPAAVLAGGVVAVVADAHDASASSVHIRQITMR